mmetsp:Transcript_16835/g.25479  ORF Transcript_16835/g.25479 Transcript_16835/m.25479 type:complete len:80 (-) Transcript_16835:210-449(-)
MTWIRAAKIWDALAWDFWIESKKSLLTLGHWDNITKDEDEDVEMKKSSMKRHSSLCSSRRLRRGLPTYMIMYKATLGRL